MWWLTTMALAGSVSDLERCLEALDQPCAEALVTELSLETSADPDELKLAAEVAFHGGDFATATKLMDKAVDRGLTGRFVPADQKLYSETARVHEGWEEEVRGKFAVRWRTGVDLVMVEAAFETLELADRHISPLLGASPPGVTAVELYPDGRSFLASSSLPEEAVKTTGVVAISKWGRLLVTSPRALGRGYGWRDTLAHEYIHLVVSHNTHDKTPVWLQEGIARYLDNRWEDGQDHFHLDPRAEGHLAQAVRNELELDYCMEPAPIRLRLAPTLEDGSPNPDYTPDIHDPFCFLSLDDMHPSVALLPSSKYASLAYTQASTLVQHTMAQGGQKVLIDVLERIDDGEVPRTALAQAAGFSDYAALAYAWRQHILGLELVERELAELGTTLDGGDALAGDPVMSERADLARRMRLGDLLRERGHAEAALVEYEQARPEQADQLSPLLAARMAQAHLELGDLEKARAELEGSLAFFPEMPISHRILGAVARAQGRYDEAIEALSKAERLDPFDVEVQEDLAELLNRQGQQQRAARHARYASILKTGGEG